MRRYLALRIYSAKADRLYLVSVEGRFLGERRVVVNLKAKASKMAQLLKVPTMKTEYSRIHDGRRKPISTSCFFDYMSTVMYVHRHTSH